MKTVFTPTDTGNFNSATSTVSLVVLPAPLSVTASNASRLYGQPNPIFGGTITGIQNADNITATYGCSATSNSPVATYPIVPALVDPNGRLGNYTVTTNNGLLTVGKATPVITWPPPAAITYGTALSGAQLGATADAPGSFVYAPSGGIVLSAGTNTLAAVLTPADTSDFNEATSTVSLVVMPAVLTVAANDASRSYGLPNHEFSASYAGFVNGESVTNSDLRGLPVLTTVADTNSPVGQYAISNSAGGLTSTNYTLVLSNGTLSVTQASLTITASNGTKVFGQTITFAGTEFRISGLFDWDSVTNVLLTSDGAAAGAAAGVYPIHASAASGSGLGNYSINYVDGLLTITPATPVTISAPIVMGDGTIKLLFSGGDIGISYRIQACSDLGNPSWTDISTNVAGTNGLPAFIDLNATNEAIRYYRIVIP